VKHRFLLVEVVFGDSGRVCSDTDIFHAVLSKVELLHGDYGWACVRPSLQVKVFDTGSCIAVLRVVADAVQILTSSLPFVNSVGSADAIFRLLYEGSSMRTVEKQLIDFNLKSLYAQLRRNPAPAEQKILRRAIARVTGSNVSGAPL